MNIRQPAWLILTLHSSIYIHSVVFVLSRGLLLQYPPGQVIAIYNWFHLPIRKRQCENAVHFVGTPFAILQPFQLYTSTHLLLVSILIWVWVGIYQVLARWKWNIHQKSHWTLLNTSKYITTNCRHPREVIINIIYY